MKEPYTRLLNAYGAKLTAERAPMLHEYLAPGGAARAPEGAAAAGRKGGAGGGQAVSGSMMSDSLSA